MKKLADGGSVPQWQQITGVITVCVRRTYLDAARGLWVPGLGPECATHPGDAGDPVTNVQS